MKRKTNDRDVDTLIAGVDKNPELQVATGKVRVEMDDGPGYPRIGLIALANDRVIERDLMRLRPSEDTLIHTCRIPFAGACSIENLAEIRDELSKAASLLDSRLCLNCVIFGCTSGAAALGPETVRDRIAKVLPGVPCVEPIGAARAAVQHLGVKRLAVVGPYIHDVVTSISGALRSPDLEVVSSTGMGLKESADICRITPETIFRFAVEADHAGADALFIACTDFRSLDVLGDIETAIHKPVVTSNQALIWSAFTTIGEDAIHPAGGQLMAGNGAAVTLPPTNDRVGGKILI